MNNIPDPAFEPVTYVLPQKRLRRLSRSGMRKSFGQSYLFSWFWLGLYACALVALLSFDGVVLRFLRSLPIVPDGLSADGLFSIVFVLLVLFFIAGLVLQRRLFRRELERRIRPENTVTLQLLTDGVSIEGATIEHCLRWPGVDQLLIEPDGLALVHGTLFFFVPAAAFKEPTAYSDFRDHVIANLTPEARARSEKEIARA